MLRVNKLRSFTTCSLSFLAAALPIAVFAAQPPRPDDERSRLAVLTDIGGDPDDQQSLIRLMMYANEFEIEALVASAAGTRGELNQAITRPDLIREIIHAYARVRPNLLRHATGWPTEEQLLRCVKPGNPRRERTHIGEGHDTEGSRFLLERIDSGTPNRPLNVAIWGGQTDLAQALWRVKHERGAAGFQAFAKKFRVFDINDQDSIADWMRDEFPGMHYILVKAPPGRDKREGAYRGMYLTGDESLTSREWVERNVRSTGPLGALYPLRTSTAPNSNGCLKEGDTPSWFFFLPLGGNDPNNPADPGWGGRYQRQPDGWYRDLPARDGFDPRHTVSQWRKDFQQDFAKRMAWCRVAPESVRRSDNAHFLQWRGKPILPIGDSVTQGWMEGGTNFDQKGYLDALATRGINVVLLWSYYATSAKAQLADGRIGYDAPELRPWKGSPDDKTIDLTTFNQAYFDRLQQFVHYAEGKGILVVITVHDGWPKKDKFAHHPFNAALGNGPLNENRQFVELADYDQEMPAAYDPKWTRQQKNQYFQERFADKLCSELNDYSNVIFEMFNEGEWYDQEHRRKHEEHFLRFFRQRTTAPLATNTDHIRSQSYEPRMNPVADILSFHKKPWTGQYQTFAKEFHREPARVVFESEPVPSFGHLQSEFGGAVSLDTLRATAWERALAGAGWMAQNDTSFGWDAKCGMAKLSKERDLAYDYIGHAARFFNGSGVAFWQMAPAGQLSSTGFCLAQPGVEYVSYAPVRAGFTMDLSAAKGKELAIRWYNPRTGECRNAGTTFGGLDAHEFNAPFQDDAVLHLKSIGKATSQIPEPGPK